MDTFCSALTRLSDSELISEVKRLAANERQATSELVASIAVLDSRRIYLAEGYPSTHAYCVGALGFSNDAAFYRITAARAVQRFPDILERLRTGDLTLKAIRLLAPHLDEEHHTELLDAAAHKSADEIEHLLAARRPRPDVPASIRKLPDRRGVQPAACDMPAPEEVPGALPVSGNGDGTMAVADDGVGQDRGDNLRRVQPAACGTPTPADAPGALPASGNGAAIAAVADDVPGRETRDRHLDAAFADGPRPGTRSTSGVSADASGGPAARQGLVVGAFGLCKDSGRALVATGPEVRCFTPLSVDETIRSRSVIEPLAPGRYKLQVTISAETRARLQRARDLLRHQVPDGDLAVVLDRALTLLVQDLERKKAAIVRRPRAEAKEAGRLGRETVTESGPLPIALPTCTPPAQTASSMKAAQERASDVATAGKKRSPVAGTTDATVAEKEDTPPTRALDFSGGRSARTRSGHIPAAVRREVWQRDGARCAFVSPDGKRCAATSQLEFHHVVPFAAGGEATVDNLALACKCHNGYEAARFFGTDYAHRRKTQPGIVDEGPTRPGTRKDLPPVDGPRPRQP